MRKTINILVAIVGVLLLSLQFMSTTHAQNAPPAENPQGGSVGITGRIPSDPPTVGATISFPTNGQSFTEVPITVSGICPSGLLVKIFKNEVFAGSVQCTESGNFTITIDLFSGQNTIVARVYDELDQPGPDSNQVNVTYDDERGTPGGVDRITLTTLFAKRGSNPGQTLKWPLTITGGIGPYALSVEWGDGNVDAISRNFAGDFDIDHIYEKPGTYKIVIRATDSEGETTFLQLVAVVNGEIDGSVADDFQSPTGGVVYDENGNPIATASNEKVVYRIMLWPLYVMLFLIVSTFWLGKRYELKKLRKKLALGQSLNF